MGGLKFVSRRTRDQQPRGTGVSMTGSVFALLGLGRNIDEACLPLVICLPRGLDLRHSDSGNPECQVRTYHGRHIRVGFIIVGGSWQIASVAAIWRPIIERTRTSLCNRQELPYPPRVQMLYGFRLCFFSRISPSSPSASYPPRSPGSRLPT